VRNLDRAARLAPWDYPPPNRTARGEWIPLPIAAADVHAYASLQGSAPNAISALSGLRHGDHRADADPGPNVSLIVANSIAYGTRFGLLTVAGTSAAIVLQLGLTTLGLTALLGAMATWFEWLRWIGVAYLVVLGVRQWRAAPLDLTRTRPQPRSVRAIALRVS